MSIANSPRSRGRNGRAAETRFVEVEVEVPQRASGHLIIELAGVGRILISDPVHVTLLAQLLAIVAHHQEGGCP